MGHKQATVWDVSLTIYGTEEVPQDVIEDTSKWMLEMNGGIDGVAHIDAQPKNPKRYTCPDCFVNVRESQREAHEEHCLAGKGP